MTRRSKIAAGIAIAVAGLTVLAILVAILLTRSTWFGNYVREKIIVAVEDSTGGKVDLASFSFDWHTLTVTARDFTIHGTEPAGAAPLFEAPLIVLKLKLFTAFKHAVDLQALRVDSPSANVMIFPNGDSNIPTPKVVRNPSSQSGLERVVDLAIQRLDISNGTVQFENRKVAFSAHGNDLRIEWLYDPHAVEYQGVVSMNPLNLSSGSNPPVNARLNVPLVMARNSIRVSNAVLETAQSKITLSGQIQNLAAPSIDGQMTAHLALAELARGFGLALNTAKNPTLDIRAALHSDPKMLRIQNAAIELNSSHAELAGDLRTGADLHAVISLPEIGNLLRMPQEPEGSVEMAGSANYDGSKYSATGTIDAKGVGFKGLPQRVSGIALRSAFRVDPDSVSISDLNLAAFGGRIIGAAQIRDWKTINASIKLNDFTIRGLAASLTNKSVNYGGAISGVVEAHGNWTAPDAHARIVITPQTSGVPVTGQVDASYTGSDGAISLNESHLNLPHTRIELSGVVGREADVRITSRNLADFQPVLTLASSTPTPVSLNGGEAQLHASVRGDFANPSISGNVNVTRLVVSGRPFDRLAANFVASPSQISLADGIVSHNSSSARFAASVGLRDWTAEPQRPLSATVTIRNGDLADAVALAGENPAGTRGQLTADVQISGTLANPQGTVQASIIDGTIRNEPFNRIALNAALADQRVDLQSLEAVAGQARVDAQGTFTHPRDSLKDGTIAFHVASNDVALSQFKTLDRWHAELAGVVNLNADLLADLSTVQGTTKVVPRTATANLKATGLRDRDQSYGDITASAITQGSAIHTSVASNFAGSSIQWSGVTQIAADYPTTAQASIRALAIEKVLAVADRGSIPVKGVLSATARISGTIHDPHAAVSFDLTRANAYDQPVDRANGSLEYSSQLINIPGFEVSSPAGRIDLHGSFAHPAASFESGKLDLHVATSALQIERVHFVDLQKPGLHGALQFTGDFNGDVQTKNGKFELLPSHLAANGAVSDLSIDNHALGGIKLQAETSGNALAVKLDSDIGKSAIHATATVSLSGDYAAQGKLTFANATYTGLNGLLDFDSAPEGFEVAAAGEADFSGPLLNPSTATGNLQITKLEVSSNQRVGGKRVALQNEGPLVAHLNQSELRIDNARLTGPSTQLQISGSAGLAKSAAMNLNLQANADLAVVKQMYQGAFSGGAVTLTSTLRGSMDQPVINGQVQFKNASLQLENWPNGIYNANGTILLNGRTATIQTLTGESGGGKITAGGFAGFVGKVLNYELHADAQHVRVRSSGASIVADGSVNLAGTSQRGLLSGTVTVERFAYSQQSDLGSILSGSGTVPPADTAGSGLLAETRLNIHVQTAPGLEFQTSAAQQLTATADLTVVGTLASPGMVGRITVTDGNLLFFGNKYTVNRGTISFYDALSIQPILDIDLQTLVQGVTVEIGASGPIQNLKLTYHSDPPLRFEDIVALLAAGTTPPDPTIAAQQPPAPNQSATQMGESALLGQAVANPITSRLQRVFGVNQFSVAPQIVSGTAIPQTRVTVQQQINPAVTFTYSQDLSQANAELVRVEWDMTSRFSAVAMRDENGIFSVDFFWRKQFR